MGKQDCYKEGHLSSIQNKSLRSAKRGSSFEELNYANQVYNKVTKIGFMLENE